MLGITLLFAVCAVGARSLDQGNTTVEWAPVTNGVRVDWELQTTPLEIKTVIDGSALVRKRIAFSAYTGESRRVGVVQIDVPSAAYASTYNAKGNIYISSCPRAYVVFNTTMLEMDQKFWTISKTLEALTITCNGEEVLNMVFADSIYSGCESEWSRDVDMIIFQGDTASMMPVQEEIIPEWVPVTNYLRMSWDLQTEPLEIKTEAVSAYRSTDSIRFAGYNDNTYVGQIAIDLPTASHVSRYNRTAVVSIFYCTSGTVAFDTPLSEDDDKFWTFTKTSEALTITCNGEEVLNMVFADSIYSGCESRWGKDVDVIRFQGDSASLIRSVQESTESSED